MKKQHIFILFVLIYAYPLHSNAQMFTGGNISLNFNNGGSVLDVAPIIGYRIKKIEVGVSPFLTYAMPKNADYMYLYGSRVFSKFYVGQDLFLYAELEAVNIEVPGNEMRMWTIGLPVGAGYEHKIGKIRVQASILYDLLLDTDSPKENPIYRGGVVYDF